MRGLVRQKEVLDQVAAVAQADHELRVPVVGVVLHQIPENRPIADVHERLWNRIGVLPEPRAEPAAKQDYFHSVVSCPSTRRNNPARSRSAAATSVVSKENPDRWAMSSSDRVPSERLSSHNNARSRLPMSRSALVLLYNPLRPSCGSHFGCKFR